MANDPGLGPRVLLVEDDPAVAGLLRDSLQSAGYRVWQAATGAEATFLAEEVHPDLVVLDLVLPDGNGLLLCTGLRARTDAAIILCSATKRRDDAVLGLQLGAMDFIAKPFYLPELMARVEVALTNREAQLTQASTPPLPDRVGDLVVDRAARTASVGGRRLGLTPTEFRLLDMLTAQAGVTVPDAALQQAIWGIVDSSVHQSLGVHARRLRAKLRAAGPGTPTLAAVRGFGYRIEPSGAPASVGSKSTEGDG